MRKKKKEVTAGAQDISAVTIKLNNSISLLIRKDHQYYTMKSERHSNG